MKGVFAGVELQIETLLLYATDAFSARVAAAAFLVDCGIIRDLIATGVSRTLTLSIAHVFELVLLITAVAFCVMRLGLAGTTTVLALLDRTTLRVDVV
jgi:hypothetical protein